MARVSLESDVLRAAIDPGLGAGVAELSVRLDGVWVAVMRKAPEEAAWFNDLASYLLVPWSNRIAGSLFEWRGRMHRPRQDWGDGTAIHGQVKNKPWRLSQRSPTMVVLRFSSSEQPPEGWPWGYDATVSYEVRGAEFRTRVSVAHRVGGECPSPMPVGIGFHPFWSRSLRGEADDVMLSVSGLRRYPCMGMIPVGAAEEPDLTRKIGAGTKLGALSMDDVFQGSTDGAEIAWPRTGVRVRYRCSPELGHTVIYTGEPGVDGEMPRFFCLEPVSMVNDGFNLATRGWKGTGVRELVVGETMSVWWTVAIEKM